MHTTILMCLTILVWIIYVMDIHHHTLDSAHALGRMPRHCTCTSRPGTHPQLCVLGSSHASIPVSLRCTRIRPRSPDAMLRWYTRTQKHVTMMHMHPPARVHPTSCSVGTRYNALAIRLGITRPRPIFLRINTLHLSKVPMTRALTPTFRYTLWARCVLALSLLRV